MTRIFRTLICVAGIVLLITAYAKLASLFAGNGSKILDVQEPLFALRYRYIFGVTGTIEALVGFHCLLSKEQRLSATLLASLSSSFVLYRVGTAWIGYHQPCPCFGSFADKLNIDPDLADQLVRFA